MYVIYQHIPYDLLNLPPEKAISYSFCAGCVPWEPTEVERRYLVDHGVGLPAEYGWSSSGFIYCDEDPDYSEKASSVANMTVYTATADIPPSSYVWLPPEKPEILAACPFHHIAVRKDTGEIIEWESG